MAAFDSYHNLKRGNATRNCRKSNWSELLKSAYLGEIENVKCLLLKNHDINSTDENGVTALMMASLKGYVDLVKLLLDKGADCHAVTKHKFNALMFAARNGHHDIVRLLLIYKTDYHLVNSQGNNSLMIASSRGHLKTVELLLGFNIDLNKINDKGLSAHMMAVISGHSQIVELLIDCGADCTTQTTIRSQEYSTQLQLKDYGCIVFSDLLSTIIKLYDWRIEEILQLFNTYQTLLKNRNYDDLEPVVDSLTELVLIEKKTEYIHLNILPLHMATHYGFVDIVKILLEHDADVNAQDHNGDTSLMIACSYSDSEIAKLLINSNTNLDLKNNLGFTALHIAVLNELTEIVEMLIEKQCNLEAKSTKGVNALLLGCLLGQENIVKILLKHNINCNIFSENGLSPLMIASCCGHSKIVTILLEHDADIDLFEITESYTPLMLATVNGNNDIVKILCERARQSRSSKIDTINAQDMFGINALNHAIHSQKTTIVKTLLSFSADCNLSCKMGRIPLHTAAEKGLTEIAHLLLEHNSLVNKLDDYGYSPLMLASADGHLDIVRELLSRDAELNNISRDDESALMLASSRGHFDIVKLLVEKGADVNIIKQNIKNALTSALLEGHLEIAKFLIENKAEGLNALQTVVNTDLTGIVKMLLEFHEIAYDQRGLGGHFDIVKFLVEQSTEVNIVNHHENNALTSVSHEDHLQIAKSLHEKAKRLYALQTSRIEIVRMLLEFHEIAYDQRGLSITLLHAAKGENYEMLQMILQKFIKYIAVGNVHYTKQTACSLPLEKMPIYGGSVQVQPFTEKELKILTLKEENNSLFTSIETISSETDIFSSTGISTLFYLANNLQFLVLEPTFYQNLLERRSFCFWLYLYFAIENEISFETIRKRIIKLYEDEPRQILECIIDPKRICYDKFKKTVHCMRRLKLCIIQQRTSPPTQENVGFITKVMKEYAKMQTFEPFQIFVHNKCLQMIATTLTIETAYDTENALIRTKYAETTMKYLKEQATFEKFKDISSPPTIYVTLCAIEIFTLYCKQVAKKFAKNGLVTFLTKLYKESCNFNKVPEFLFRSVNILQNLARFEEARTYFTECKTIEALSVCFETSNCKELIIFLISMIDGEASQLPSLRDKDIQSYIDVTSKNDAACLSLNWLKGLKMVTQKYDSSRSKLSKHFTFFTKILADEIPEFQDTVMQILRVISSSSEACAAISKDQDLCKTISKCREMDSNIGRDAEIVYWNMSRESGNLPVFPTKNHLLDYVGTAELYSSEFPKNIEFKEQLGKGSFGTVYVVKDLDQPDKVQFVAKQISIDTKHTVEHLLAEANILLKAKHQNIVRFHGYCIKKMSIYLLMEYMQMGTLSSYVIDKNGLCENKTRLFTKQILEGLNYLHQTKILHQDIKGNNILLENENIVKIAASGFQK